MSQKKILKTRHLSCLNSQGCIGFLSSHDEDFHDLIAERYERTATILTSNLDFGEWGDAFAANKMLGAATLDRLRHAAYRVILDGDSYRAPRSLPDTPKPSLAKGGKNTHS
jgi:hypothetical protein